VKVRRRTGSGLGLFVATTLLMACSPARREAASLIAAVDRFHRVSNAEEPTAADYLATVPCTDHDVCEAKAACVKATNATARALRLMSEAEAGLALLKAGKLSPDDAEAKALAGKLSQATELLADGHAEMPLCDARIVKLKATHGL
jgi:hypothetical protein